MTRQAMNLHTSILILTYLDRRCVNMDHISARSQAVGDEPRIVTHPSILRWILTRYQPPYSQDRPRRTDRMRNQPLYRYSEEALKLFVRFRTPSLRRSPRLAVRPAARLPASPLCPSPEASHACQGQYLKRKRCSLH